MQDFKIWYSQFPLVTRTYITGIIIVSLMDKLRLIKFASLLFLPDFMIYKFQIWRLFTDYFVAGSFSFHYIFTILLIYFAFSKSEALYEGPNFADYLYLLAYILLLIDILAYIFNYAVLYRSLMYALIYIWCKRKPFETVTFYFGIRVQSAYFPWVLMGFHFIIGEDITQDLFGLAAGHSYIVLKDLLPVTHNKRFLETPKFFKRAIDKYIQPYTTYGQNLFRNQARQQGPQQQGFRFFQGQGVRLG